MQKKRVKTISFVILSVALILLASMFVYAAGESTTRSATTTNNNSDSSKKVCRVVGSNCNCGFICSDIPDNERVDCARACSAEETNNTKPSCGYVNGVCQQVSRNSTNIDCESSSNRTERIKCRLENREEVKARVVERIKAYNNDTSTYEACQGLRNEGLCVALYAQSQRCYRLNDTERDRCFKKVAAFREAQINKSIEVESNKTEARERVKHYMILVLYNLQEKVEKANENGRITSEDAAQIIDKIVEIKRAILEGATKAEIRSQLAELKQLWRTALGNVNNEGEDTE